MRVDRKLILDLEREREKQCSWRSNDLGTDVNHVHAAMLVALFVLWTSTCIHLNGYAGDVEYYSIKSMQRSVV